MDGCNENIPLNLEVKKPYKKKDVGIKLRLYQKRLVNQAYLSLIKHDSVVIQSPTGSGKGAIIAQILADYSKKCMHCVFIIHKEIILLQISKHLKSLGVDHGIILNSYPQKRNSFIQLCSVQSIHRKCLKDKRLKIPKCDLIVWDEAHFSPSRTGCEVLEALDSKIIALTATPMRNGKGLGDIYDDLVCGPTHNDLVDMGYLSAIRYFVPTKIDLSKMKALGSDITTETNDRTYNQPKLVGKTIDVWEDLANGAPTLVFASSIKHSKNVVEEFVSRGINACHIDGRTPSEERKVLFDMFLSGQMKVISNVDCISEGVDLPSSEVVLLARSTKSLPKWMQMVGRITRVSESKLFGMVIDCAGNFEYHGPVEHITEWFLQKGGENAEVVERNEKDRDNERICGSCKTVYNTGVYMQCPSCGSAPECSIMPLYVEAKLIEAKVEEEKRIKLKQKDVSLYTDGERNVYFKQLLGFAIIKKYKSYWATNAFKKKFKCEPLFTDKVPTEPSPEVRRYAQYLSIAYNAAKYGKKGRYGRKKA
jgi:superfamily II DNA or RNA helicase